MAVAVGDNRKVVTTAGTRVPIEDSAHEVEEVTIVAETNNTGYIVVGGENVVASLSTRRGIPLNPGDSKTFYKIDLNKTYIDSIVSGDGVTYAYTW